MPGSRPLKIRIMVSLGTATAIALGSCQSVTTNVNAIMKHDDVPQLSREQQNAFSAFESGQFSKAVKLFKQAIAIEPDAGLKATLYNGLGSSHNELNQPTQAIEAYLESLKLNQQNAQVWVNLGIAQRLIGEYDEALKSYRAALKLDSSLATAYSSIGSLRVLKGQPELAIDAFNSAIAIDENLAVTHGNLALAYAMVKQFDQAQQSLKRAIALGYENGDLVQSRINELKPQP